VKIINKAFTLIAICILNLGAGAQVSFNLSSSPVVGNGTSGNNTDSVAAGDVNGDGSIDLISANYSDNSLTVVTNIGNGQFILSNTYQVGAGPACVTAVDINGDGKVDLLSANTADNTISVLTNTGSGGFVLSSNYVVGAGPTWITTADVNGDGSKDLISANYNDSTVTVLTNNGAGEFSIAGTYQVGFGPVCVIAADILGNGKLDLITANWGGGGGDGNTLTVLTNDGTGNFAMGYTLTVGAGTRSVAAADVNGDGKIDLISGDMLANTLTVLTNSGNGGFSVSGVYQVGTWPSSVGAADLNGDGIPDLYCPNRNDNTVSVLTNNGSGGFVSAGAFPVDNHPYNATAADVNGDGNIDLITANQYSFDLSVLTNGTPFPANRILITAQPQSTTNNLGDTVILSGSSTNSGLLSYQWYFDNNPVNNATNTSLMISNIQQSNFGDYYVVVAGLGGRTTSQVANLFEPATITREPTNLVAAYDSSATFSVAAVGYPAINFYQWSLNGTNIPGANSNSLTINKLSLAATGNYQVLASNAISSATSSVATLDISPSIAVPFVGATPIWGQSATLSVGAIGNGTLSYQWYFNGTPITGATGPGLNFPSIQFTNNGFYSVVISSPYGSITNVAAQVAVNPAVVSLGFSPTLTINGAAGNSYLIQRSADLTNTNNWKNMTTLTLFQQQQIWVDTSIDASSPFNNKYFYQLIPQY